MTTPIINTNGEFHETNDPLALASLILAELESRPDSGRTVITLALSPPRYLLTTDQALAVARRACATVLYGEPDPCTYDRADLEMAITILGQMLATLELKADAFRKETEYDESN